MVKSANGEEPTIYFEEYMFHWNSNCAGTPDRTESTAFGACIGGIDENGQPIDTWKTVLNSTDDTHLTFTNIYYTTQDCSGSPISANTYTYATNQCVADTEYKVTDKNNPTPWVGENSGVVVKTFANADCSAAPEVFQSVKMGYCLGITDPGNGAQSMAYSSCDSQSYTIQYYSDWGCSVPLEKAVLPANVCRKCPDGANCYPQGFWYQNYETISCNA